MGVGLVDFMTKVQIDPETGDSLPAFGVFGGTSEDIMETYRKINKEPGIEKDAMYLIKASAPINTEAYSYAKTQMSSGRVKMLIDERTASAKLMETKVGQNMAPMERATYLLPFNQTTFLKNQMLNLIQENEGMNIILKQSSRGINKDKFSAFIYGLYCIKEEEILNKKRKSKNITDFLFFT